MPGIEAMTSVGVTPYSTGAGDLSHMKWHPDYDDGHHIKRLVAAPSQNTAVILRSRALARRLERSPLAPASILRGSPKKGEHLRMTTVYVASAYEAFFARIRSANRLNR
jgi:hypothetical protein